MKRRDFIKKTAAGVGQAVLINTIGSKIIAGENGTAYENFEKVDDKTFKALADKAIETAKSAGASYADIRVCKNRNQQVSTREDRVQGISESDDFGFGIRVIANGSWGFAASSVVTDEEVMKQARLAVEIAKANSILQVKPIELAPTQTYVDTWKTPIRTNPFDISITDKIDLQLKLNAKAKSDGADFCDSFMWFVNEWKYFASSEGSYITQDLYRVWAQTNPTVIDKTSGMFESRKTLSTPVGMGYEYIEDFPWDKEIETAVEHAKMKLKAPSVKAERRDLIIDATNLFLTIHESCGHPTELDRALGYEANYAGTSFMTPDKLGKLKYGSDLITMRGDKTMKNGLSTRGYDDDGVKTTEFKIVENGIFKNYQTTRELAGYVGDTKSHACAFADSWEHFPIQRMPNVSLMPGEKKMSLDDMIADTDNAILIIGDGSWSIDMQRYNFQFTGQEFWEIKNGKRAGMLRDVAYQGNTVDFWNSCDALCDESEFWVGGSFFCGKGEPGQVAPVSHGCVPARFRNINVLNTKEEK